MFPDSLESHDYLHYIFNPVDSTYGMYFRKRRKGKSILLDYSYKFNKKAERYILWPDGVDTSNIKRNEYGKISELGRTSFEYDSLGRLTQEEWSYNSFPNVVVEQTQYDYIDSSEQIKTITFLNFYEGAAPENKDSTIITYEYQDQRVVRTQSQSINKRNPYGNSNNRQSISNYVYNDEGLLIQISGYHIINEERINFGTRYEYFFCEKQ